MLYLQIYLIAGLVFHKLVWEALRGKASQKPVERRSLAIRFIKALKVGLLVAVMIQVFIQDVLPISGEPFFIRVVGVLIFTAGLLIAVGARFQLGENWANIETGQVLQSQTVVAKGIYSLVRHPIYVGDILLLLGLQLALNSWLVLGIFVLAPIVMYMAIKEERMLLKNLAGDQAYCRSSKRFIPFVY
jgi:protein-S-isoprenylcysteine O-methyltransferase Ste14